MIAPEAVEKLLENPIVRLVTGFGFVLLVSRLLTSLFFNIIGLTRSFNSVFYDSIWNIRYIEALAALLTLTGWTLMSLTRRFEQPWWLLVGGALLAWVFVVMPVASEIHDRLWQLLSIGAVGLQLAAALLALVTLDKAVPKLAAAPVVPQAQPPAAQALATQAPAAQPPGGQPAGWYEDPRGEAKWRWWDGQDWTENTG